MADAGELVERLRRKCVHTHPADAETMIEAADLIDRLTKTSEADVERVIADLHQRLRDGDDAKDGWTDAGMDDAFFRWRIIERELRAALEAMKGGAA